jgi:hypothetical protein
MFKSSRVIPHISDADAGVNEQSDHCLIPTVGEFLAVARCNQRAELSVGQHWHRPFGRLGWAPLSLDIREKTAPD